MAIDRAFYMRQLLLPEVGLAGQEALARASAPVGAVDESEATFANEVATRYAERTGFGGVSAAPLDLERLAPSSFFRHEGPRSVAAGCRAVIAASRPLLGLGHSPPRTDVAAEALPSRG